MSVKESVVKGVKAGVQNMMESMKDDVSKFIESPDDGSSRIRWTGDLAASITLEQEGDEYRLVARAPYSEYVEKGSEQLHFYPFFFESGELTSLGMWAIDQNKLGFSMPDEFGAHYLVNSSGKRFRGLYVNRAHPFMESESHVFKKYTEGDEGVNIIRQHIIDELRAAGYAVEA